MRANRFVVGVLLMTAAAFAGEPAGTLNVDAVELVRGREVEGSAGISAMHYRYTYLFANEENKVEFEKAPERYEIQLGGACGRMGALSGLGKTDLFATHQARIYIFASESCRATFLRDPAKVLDRPDDTPEGSAEAKRRGSELIERAVEGMGGAARVDAVANYRYRRSRRSESKGKMYEIVDTVTLKFPDGIRTDHVWGDQRYTKVVTANDAWGDEPEGLYPLHSQQRDAAVKRYLGYNMLAILKSRGRPDFVAVHEGSRKIEYDGGPMAIEFVKVHANLATSTLGIDPETGRILTQSFRGRGSNVTFGKVERAFTDFVEIDGVTLPKSYEARFDGEDAEQSSAGDVSLALNVEQEGGFFTRPD